MDINTILGTGGAVAVIVGLKDLVMWLINRNAQKHDKKDDKEDALCGLKAAMEEGFESLRQLYMAQAEELAHLKATVSSLDEQSKVQLNGLQAQLGNTIKFLAQKYIRRGKITFQEMADLEHLYEVYHLCGGNGPITEIMCQCRKLEIVA